MIMVVLFILIILQQISYVHSEFSIWQPGFVLTFQFPTKSSWEKAEPAKAGQWLSGSSQGLYAKFSVICEGNLTTNIPTKTINAMFNEDDGIQIKMWPKNNNDNVDNHLYIFYPLKVTYNNAKRKCNNLGLNMVKIESKEENDIVTDLCHQSKQSYGCWLGLQERIGTEIWYWNSDNANLDSVNNYTNWAVNEPDNPSIYQWDQYTPKEKVISDNDVAIIGYKTGKPRAGDRTGGIFAGIMAICVGTLGLLAMPEKPWNSHSVSNVLFFLKMGIVNVGNESLITNQRLQDFFTEVALLAALLMTCGISMFAADVSSEDPNDQEIHGMCWIATIFVFAVTTLCSFVILLCLSKCDEGPQTDKFLQNMYWALRIPLWGLTLGTVFLLCGIVHYMELKFKNTSDYRFQGVLGFIGGTVLLLMQFILVSSYAFRRAHNRTTDMTKIIQGKFYNCFKRKTDGENSDKYSVSTIKVKQLKEYSSLTMKAIEDIFQIYLDDKITDLLDLDLEEWLAYLEHKADELFGDAKHLTSTRKKVSTIYFEEYVEKNMIGTYGGWTRSNTHLSSLMDDQNDVDDESKTNNKYTINSNDTKKKEERSRSNKMRKKFTTSPVLL